MLAAHRRKVAREPVACFRDIKDKKNIEDFPGGLGLGAWKHLESRKLVF